MEKADLKWARSLLEQSMKSFTGVESHDGRQHSLDQWRWEQRMGGDEERKRLMESAALRSVWGQRMTMVFTGSALEAQEVMGTGWHMKV